MTKRHLLAATAAGLLALAGCSTTSPQPETVAGATCLTTLELTEA